MDPPRPSRRANCPLPVLLFGVTILRVTCNDTWARRKALKSRQRAILVDLDGRTPHQRQYFRKFRHFDTTGACTKLLVHSQLGLWATPGADTWRGPSHDTLELFDSEGFSIKAPGREPEPREDRNRIIGVSRFR